jgi:mRNA interferase RelE/StbE
LSYKIAFKKSVARDLKKIDSVQADKILRKIEDELPVKAESFPVLTGKFSGLRKFRVGDYRVIDSIIGETALILIIGYAISARMSRCRSHINYWSPGPGVSRHRPMCRRILSPNAS